MDRSCDFPQEAGGGDSQGKWARTHSAEVPYKGGQEHQMQVQTNIVHMHNLLTFVKYSNAFKILGCFKVLRSTLLNNRSYGS